MYFLGFGILVAIIVSFVNYQSSFTNIEKKIRKIADTEIENKRNYLHNYILQTEMLLNSIKKSDLTLNYIKSKSEQNRKNLNDLFYALTKSNKDIMQLRYIDATGKEQIRIDRDRLSYDLKVVLDDKLQDKSSRYYFKETSLIMTNEFWHSNIDLNIENGKIERPFKPTFRVATQLVIDGKFKGIIIANLLFKDSIEILSHSATFNIYLIDKNGEVIHTPNHKNSWSKYLENSNSLKNIYPKYANNILTHTNYSMQGLYSFTLGDLFKNQENLKVVFETKIDTQNNLEEQNSFTALIIALTVILVSVPLSFIISIIPSKLQIELAKSYEKIRKSSEIIDKYIMISKTDKNGIITDISKKFTSITNYEANEIIGKNHTVLSHPDTPKKVYKNLWRTITSGKVWENDIQDLTKSGKPFWLHLVISPEFNQQNEIEGYTAIAQDITDKKTIEEMSITDYLTKLYNRREIESVVETEITRADRYNTNFSIVFIDIDKFKNINDTFGHNVGDDILVELSKILKLKSRKTDTVGRWGGEEFIIVCSETDIDGAFDFANNLRETIENHKFLTVKKVTISCGVSQYEKIDTLSSVIAKADDALYRAKENGRNKVEKG
jgi:diguanylate cyclase (GGDEF)-like protein/PAS domain S-box-containing protein